jgi:uncharacterized protein (TIGR03382 family)
MKRLLVLGALCLLAGFHQPATFEASASDGGGQRVYFDGSPRQKSYDCTLCHDTPARTIAAKIDFAPAADGAYTPGTTYMLTVTLAGEHLGMATANNQNGFLAELVDDMRVPAGKLATPDVDVVKIIDDGAVAAGEGKDMTMWKLSWTAPAAGAGPVTLHLGMIDGNGAASASAPQNDPGGDDVAVAHVRLCEGAPGCGEPSKPELTDSKAAGCNAAHDASPLVLVLVLVLVLARRRRAVLLACALAGCYAPNTPTECPDHVCGGTGGVDAAINTCTEAWVCTSWEAPAGSDQATRTCIDTNNRGTTDCKPATMATLPPLDVDYYKCRVHPIFQRGCGQMNCHGTDDKHPFRVYSRGRWRNDELVPDRGSCLLPAGSLQPLRDLGAGTVMCEGWYPHTAAEWKKSFDSARSFMLDVTSPDDSLLLLEPAKGGLPHAQVKLFAAGDTDYQTIRAWLNGAAYGMTCNTGAN